MSSRSHKIKSIEKQRRSGNVIVKETSRQLAMRIEQMIPKQSFGERMRFNYKRNFKFIQEIEDQVMLKVEEWNESEISDFCEAQSIPLKCIQEWNFQRRVKIFSSLILQSTDLNEWASESILRIFNRNDMNRSLHELADTAELFRQDAKKYQE